MYFNIYNKKASHIVRHNSLEWYDDDEMKMSDVCLVAFVVVIVVVLLCIIMVVFVKFCKFT